MGAEPSNWSAFGRGEFPGTSFGTSSNYTETSGVKSGSARSPKGGGRGERRWNEVKGNSAAWPTIHHAWSLALTARYRSFFTQTAPPSFSNPPPRVSSLSRNRGQFFESRSSGSLERFSKNGTRERERKRKDRETRFDLHFPPRYTDTRHRYRSLSWPLLPDENVERLRVLAFTYRKSKPWKTGA